MFSGFLGQYILHYGNIIVVDYAVVLRRIKQWELLQTAAPSIAQLP